MNEGRKCKQCGTDLGEDVRFCPNCGLQNDVEENVGSPIQTTDGGFNNPPEEKRVRKGISGKAKVIIGVVAVLVAAVVVCVLNADYIVNFYKLKVSSPEEYYQYVEQKSAEQMAESVSASYNGIFLEYMDLGSKKISGEMKVVPGQKVKSIAYLLASKSISWLESISMEYEINGSDEKASVGIRGKVNDSEILSFDTILNAAARQILIKPGDTAEKYMDIRLEDFASERELKDLDKIKEVTDLLGELKNDMPSEKEVKDLINKYMSLAINCINKIDKSEELLTAEGVSNEYTALRIMIDGEVLKSIAEKVLNEMKDDGELKKIILRLAGSEALRKLTGSEGDPEDVYKGLIEAVDSMLKETDRIKKNADEMEITLWVDGKGEIVGRAIKSGNEELKVVYPTDGKEFGFDMSISSLGNMVSVRGKGTTGSEITGELKVKNNGETLADISIEGLSVGKLKKGYIDGKFTIRPAVDLSQNSSSMLPVFGSGDIGIELDLELDENNKKIATAILLNKDRLIEFSFSVNTGKGSDIKIPGENETTAIKEEDDVKDYITSLNIDKAVQRLKDAGADSDMCNSIKNAFKDAIQLISDSGYEE